VAGGTAEGGADGDDEQGDGERADLARGVAEPQDDVDQHEGADDLGDQVVAGAGDGRAGGEGAQRGTGLVRLVVVLPVRGPGQDGAEEGADQFSGEVDQRAAGGDVDTRCVLIGPADPQTD